ncbi:MraY family glycosyltransferase [Wenzhouxiangella sediminis]|uniref:MraY family glycosyltransferase n=1 Tax=Wenzhouxiangella sediminis TaxID=1792836 RepID=UPI0015F2690A|nr:MraY family glycosyltransferase [Wenzhouxiangella sediminis]
MAHSTGLVDDPCERRRHKQSTPVVGGIGIVLGYLVAAALLDLPLASGWGTFLAGVILLGTVGVVDDAFEVSSRFRLLTQFGVVAAVLWIGDLQINQLGNLTGFGPIGLWIFAPVFTLLCMMLMINAVNMLDGVDGLAGGTSLVTLAGFAALLWLDGASGWQAPLLFSMAVVGFLAYNLRGPWRKSASVFMGDAGSTVLGFVLAWLAVYATQAEGATVYPVAVAWMLVLPAADALSLFFRRLAKGRNPLSADRCHLHHVLVRSGLSMTTTVYLLILGQTVFVGIGIVGWHYRVSEWVMFWPLAVMFAAYQLVMWRADLVLRGLRRKLRGS